MGLRDPIGAGTVAHAGRLFHFVRPHVVDQRNAAVLEHGKAQPTDRLILRSPSEDAANSGGKGLVDDDHWLTRNLTVCASGDVPREHLSESGDGAEDKLHPLTRGGQDEFGASVRFDLPPPSSRGTRAAQVGGAFS